MRISIANGTTSQIQETLIPEGGHSLPSEISADGVTFDYNSHTGIVVLTNLSNLMTLQATATPDSTILFNFLAISKVMVNGRDINKIIFNNATLYEKQDKIYYLHTMNCNDYTFGMNSGFTIYMVTDYDTDLTGYSGYNITDELLEGITDTYTTERTWIQGFGGGGQRALQEPGPPIPSFNQFTFDNDPTLSLKSYDFLAFELSGYVEGQFATYELSNISVNSDIVTQQTNTSQTDTPSRIDTPTNVLIEGDEISFDEVEGAESYDILFNGDVIGTYVPTIASLISFSIDGTTYQAEEGMTWSQWIDSNYNTGNFIDNGNVVVSNTAGHIMVGTVACDYMSSSDGIIPNYSYVIFNDGACQ